jgi:aminoglycoside phosphotransferase (APT) family kinase protein
MFMQIELSKDWKNVAPISKGWSSDKKYLVETADGKLQLLRISDIEAYEAKKKEYEIITKYSQLGINMSMPIEFGICNEGKNVYMLLSWVEGRDLEEVLPELSEQEQYKLGRQAGTILRKIHSIPLDPADVPATTKREKKLTQLARYEESNVRISSDEIAVAYVKENINSIWQKTPVYMHGDFHPGNLIYMQDGSIGVIDFNRWEVGDPYEEFYKLESFGIEISVPYCIGQIDAYFNDDVPVDFWTANAVYVAQASLFSIKWAEKFGQADVDGMVRRARASMKNFDNFNLSVPKWYSNTLGKFNKDVL